MSDTTINKKKSGPSDNKASEDGRSAAEKEIDDAIADNAAKLAKKKTRKRKIIKGSLLTFSLLVAYIIYWGLKPMQGTMAFGICKTFIEMNVRFPSTLRLSTVEQFATSVRIWYVQVDAFGEYRLEPIQCYFKPDKSLPFVVEKITSNRREIDPQLVTNFNRILPMIFANPPDLALPWGLPDSLGALKFDVDKYRKPILDRMPGR